MTPRLVLEFNSQGRSSGDSFAGLGSHWTIGRECIEHKRGTTGTYLYRRGFFTSELVACAFSPCASPWEPGEYRAKIDDGSDVRFFFDGVYWVAYDKRGGKRVFGQSARDYEDPTGSIGTPYRWLIEREEDTSHNAILYTYGACDVYYGCNYRSVGINYPAVVDANGAVVTEGAYNIGVGSDVVAVRDNAKPYSNILYSYGISRQAVDLREPHYYNGQGVAKRLLTITQSVGDYALQQWGTGGTVAYRTGGTLRGIVVTGDFNGDGRTDIARTEPGWTKWDVSLSTGNGFVTRSWTTSTAHSDTYRVVVGDFDGDGRADIARAALGSSSVAILHSTGDGFQETSWPTGVFRAPPAGGTAKDVAILVGDFNGDGLSDIASAGSGDTYWAVALARQDHQGFDTSAWFLGAPALEALADGMEVVTVGDFTGDGRSDIARVRGTGDWKVAVANEYGNGFSLYTFGGGPQIAQTNTLNLFAGDMNGDGLTDVSTVKCGYLAETCLFMAGDGTRYPSCTYACYAYQCGLPAYPSGYECNVCWAPTCGGTCSQWTRMASVEGYSVHQKCMVTDYVAGGAHFRQDRQYSVARDFATPSLLAPVTGWSQVPNALPGDSATIVAEIKQTLTSGATNGIWLPFSGSSPGDGIPDMVTPFCSPQDLVVGDFNGSAGRTSRALLRGARPGT
jgi:hypothetical protein